jgi:hypothetical protein
MNRSSVFLPNGSIREQIHDSGDYILSSQGVSKKDEHKQISDKLSEGNCSLCNPIPDLCDFARDAIVIASSCRIGVFFTLFFTHSV